MAGGGDRGDDRGGRMSEQEPEERTDGWMATYSDMVTLLLTFFVLMFAISNVDQQKFELFFAGLRPEGLSAEEFLDIVERFGPGEDPDYIDFPYPYDPDGDRDGGDDRQDPDGGEGEVGNPELTALYELLDGYISTAGIGEHIQLVFDGEYLLMTLRNDILFESARAEVLPDMRYIAEVIARLIAGTHNPENPFEIVVTGHTDNRPIATNEFPSNWHVSVRRAVNFAEILIEESGIDPYYFQARGASEYRPIATNDTPEGRQLNRRVEVQVTIPRAEYRRDDDMVSEFGPEAAPEAAPDMEQEMEHESEDGTEPVTDPEIEPGDSGVEPEPEP